MEAMHLAEDELKRYLILRRVKLKLRAALILGKLGGKLLRSHKVALEDIIVNKKRTRIEFLSEQRNKLKMLFSC